MSTSAILCTTNSSSVQARERWQNFENSLKKAFFPEHPVHLEESSGCLEDPRGTTAMITPSQTRSRPIIPGNKPDEFLNISLDVDDDIVILKDRTEKRNMYIQYKYIHICIENYSIDAFQRSIVVFDCCI